jgi:hypothetical protein
MYISKAAILNIRSLEHASWTCPRQRPGWHVVLGDNASGKTTVVRSIALALVGVIDAAPMLLPWKSWVREGAVEGKVFLAVESTAGWDSASAGLAHPQGRYEAELWMNSGPGWDLQGKETLPYQDSRLGGEALGWFSASYGPFRRFVGGGPDAESQWASRPRLAAHMSAFGEHIALSATVRWLQELQFKKLEGATQGETLDRVVAFINQPGFLPHGARLDRITSDTVTFVDPNGHHVSIADMSDGYRSMLRLTFDIVRQMTRVYDPGRIFSADGPGIVAAPGVVLIDEVDAHLHPTWQQTVGFWLVRHFPKVQFIVTTHSPLICQAALNGSVFLLPKPGANEEGRMLEGPELDRLLYGNVLDAYATQAFGEITRSPEGQRRLERLAELNQLEFERNLTDDEIAEQTQLRAALPTAAHAVRGTAR